jgi:iron(III) transport system permease protein
MSVAPDLVGAGALPYPARKRFDVYGFVVGLTIVAVLLLIVVPVGRMLVRTFYVDGVFDLAGPLLIFHAPWLPKVIIDTAIIVGTSTVLTVLLGAFLAWLNERTDADLGLAGSIMPLTPLLIPNIALAIGWVLIGDNRVGLAKGVLGAIPVIGGALSASIDIYSWAGLIWLYVVNGLPMVYLVVAAALNNIDPAIEEASRISGAGPMQTLRRVSLPAVGPAILAATLLVAVSNLGLFSIPTVVATPAGIDILAVRIVNLINNSYPPAYPEAQILGVIKLIIVAALWMMYSRISRRGHFATAGGRAAGFSRLQLGFWRWPARAVMMGYMACAAFLPLVALIIVALQPFWTPRVDVTKFTLDRFVSVIVSNRLTVDAFRNSLMLSTIGASVALAIASLSAIYLNQRSGLLAQVIDGALKLPAVVPNVVIALGFLLTFVGAPLYISGTPLLLLAFIVIYLPSGSIAATASVAQIGRDLQEASAIAGASEFRTTMRIVVPLALPGIVAGWTVVFVHMMGDLSASALLAGVNSPVVGFAILQIWENGSFGELAAFSVCMCVIIAVVVLVSTVLVRRMSRRGGR